MLIPPLRELKKNSNHSEVDEVSDNAVLAQYCTPHPLSCKPEDNFGL